MAKIYAFSANPLQLTIQGSAFTLEQQLPNVGKQLHYADCYFNYCRTYLLLAVCQIS